MATTPSRVAAAAVMAELSFDLRAMRAAVPIAQRETLGAELDAERLERLAQVTFRET